MRTNDDRRLVIVPQRYVKRAFDRAEEIVAWYASEEGQRSLSRSVSGPWGAERDPIRQSTGKIGEVAVAIFFNLDPETAIFWSAGTGGDGNSDIKLPRYLVDVKTNVAQRKEFYWSMAVNHLFQSKRFDVLISVSYEDYKFQNCWLEGWISKQNFYEQKKIASKSDGTGLTPGTWYMNKRELLSIDSLLSTRATV